MTLIVEDGTKPANANSYITLDYANSYHTMMGNTSWSGDDSDLEQAIIIATQSVELLFGHKYLSQRLLGVQSLLWPRYPMWDNYLNLILQSVIPTSLQNAVAEAALLSLTGIEMFPDISQLNNVQRIDDKVGEIEESIQYFGKSRLSTYENFRKVELLLYPIIQKKRNTITLSR